eukprot:GHVR01000120.1.p1 GENE.GHVR01000120.1~~GHVR01000120.1.p1  ORF type:complete len:144 (+),score=6.77 GHVR01000120.1:541-972(+)
MTKRCYRCYFRFQDAEACIHPWPCARHYEEDFSKHCPEGWLMIAGNRCMHPGNYFGPCLSKPGYEPDFSQFDAIMKARWARRCNTHWPRKKICPSDYSFPCPAEWTLLGILCVAPSAYEGSCKLEFDMSSFHGEEKRKFEEKW